MQLEAKGLEAALWQQRVQAQQDLVAAGQQREAVLQEQMATLRTQVGETSNVLEQHLTNYSQYQQTIDQSSQVRLLRPALTGEVVAQGQDEHVLLATEEVPWLLWRLEQPDDASGSCTGRCAV